MSRGVPSDGATPTLGSAQRPFVLATLLATVQDPLAVQAILAHWARSGGRAPLGPAPPAPAALP